MKGKLWILLILTLMLATIDRKISNNHLSETQPVTAATPSCTPSGLIISAEGDRSIAAGSQLCSEQRLQPINGAKITVICYANKQVSNLPNCPPVLIAEDICNPKDSEDCGGAPRGPDEILKIISPPDTTSLLLNERLKLSWSKVPEANSYLVQVHVVGGGREWQSPEPIKGTEIDYPDNAPALQPERLYEVIVQADNDKVGSATFTMLSESEDEQIRKLEQQIAGLKNVPKDEQALALAYLYQGKRLFAQAIKTLEAVKKESQKVRIYQILGDLYLQVKLPNLAKSEYEQALQLATNDQERAAVLYRLGAANAKISNFNEAINKLESAHSISNSTQLKTYIARFLGETYRQTDKDKEAIRYFEEALAGYQTLNDQSGIDKVQRRLEQLKHR